MKNSHAIGIVFGLCAVTSAILGSESSATICAILAMFNVALPVFKKEK